MKKLLLVLFVIPVLVLAGCGKKTDTDIGSTDDHSSPDGLDVVACNNYVDYISCIADSMGDAGKTTKQALEKTVKAREKMPTEQLEQICQAAINGVSQVLDMYKDYNCTLQGAVPKNAVNPSDNIEEENLEVAGSDARVEVIEEDAALSEDVQLNVIEEEENQAE